LKPAPLFTIRPINALDAAEIEWVAQGMRATLIEVEGEAVGTALYDLDWLRDRVRQHLDGRVAAAQVLLAEDAQGRFLGYTIVRREGEAAEASYGLVSTTYVAPPARRQGLADALLQAGEQWMQSRHLPHSATWTSATNTPLIRLYAKHGYVQTATHDHVTTGTPMVRLERAL
jgi:GNAT superfamily N-acetyltransferase